MLKLSFLFTLVLERCQHFTNIFSRSFLLLFRSCFFFGCQFKLTSLVNLYDVYIRHNKCQIMQEGMSWSWLYGSWVYNYLCNQWPITTSLNSAHSKVYSIQLYVIKFVSNLWPVGGFLRVLWFLHLMNLIVTM